MFPNRYLFDFHPRFFFSLTFFLVSLTFLFSCSQQRQMSATERIAEKYLKNMEKSAISLQHAMDEVSHLKRLNTIGRLETAQKSIKEVHIKLNRANENEKTYCVYILKNKKRLKQKQLNYYIPIVGLFNDTLTKKRNSMDNYLSAMDKWLEYSIKNYIKLKEGVSTHRRNYDQYLITVNRRLTAYNLANNKYHNFVKSFVKQHPSLAKKFKRQYKTMKKEMGWL